MREPGISFGSERFYISLNKSPGGQIKCKIGCVQSLLACWMTNSMLDTADKLESRSLAHCPDGAKLRWALMSSHDDLSTFAESSKWGQSWGQTGLVARPPSSSASSGSSAKKAANVFVRRQATKAAQLCFWGNCPSMWLLSQPKLMRSQSNASLNSNLLSGTPEGAMLLDWPHINLRLLYGNKILSL